MRKLIITFLSLIFCIYAYPQEQTQSIEEQVTELSNFQILGCENQLNTNVAYLNQVGDNNNIVAIQQNTGAVPNQIISIQEGEGNQGYIEQSGPAHLIILRQDGWNNEANLWSEGAKTDTWVSQVGDNNIINSYIDNAGLLPKAALLKQDGSNNVIDFALLGNGCLWNSWPKGAYIKQTGDDLEVTALFDSYQSPVYIEQQSGANGGMKVNVSNTTFSFPMKKY